MAQTKVHMNQIDGDAYAFGAVASNTATGIKTLYPTASVGITFNGSNMYTVVTKGIYFIHGQQLMTTGASATYFRIDINGAATKYGYIPGSTMADAIASYMGELNIGDTIRFYQENAINAAWEGPHSAFQIYLIKAT